MYVIVFSLKSSRLKSYLTFRSVLHYVKKGKCCRSKNEDVHELTLTTRHSLTFLTKNLRFPQRNVKSFGGHMFLWKSSHFEFKCKMKCTHPFLLSAQNTYWDTHILRQSSSSTIIFEGRLVLFSSALCTHFILTSQIQETKFTLWFIRKERSLVSTLLHLSSISCCVQKLKLRLAGLRQIRRRSHSASSRLFRKMSLSLSTVF